MPCIKTYSREHYNSANKDKFEFSFRIHWHTTTNFTVAGTLNKSKSSQLEIFEQQSKVTLNRNYEVAALWNESKQSDII